MKEESLRKIESMQVRIEKDLKDQFFAISKKKGLTASEAVHQFIEQSISTASEESLGLGGNGNNVEPRQFVLAQTIGVRNEVERLVRTSQNRSGKIKSFNLGKINSSENQLVIIMTVRESDSRAYPDEKRFSFRDSETQLFYYYSPKCKTRMEEERKKAEEERKHRETESALNRERAAEQNRYNQAKIAVLQRQNRKDETELDDEIQKELKKIKGEGG